MTVLDDIAEFGIKFVFQLIVGITSVRVLVEQIQLISRKCLNVIGDDVVK